MRKGNSTKKIFSVITLVMYIFVVFFAQNLHSHHSSDFFKDLRIQKSEHSLKKASDESNSEHCLSCHFMFDGHSFSPSTPTYHFTPISEYHDPVTGFVNAYNSCPLRSFSLRGPPSLV